MKRSALNPILTREDIPPLGAARDVSSVFNPGAVKHAGRYLLLLRVQTRGRETLLALAESKDGRAFTVRLERPNMVSLAGGLPSGSAITLSTSGDLLTWWREGTVMEGRPRYWDELIGAGPPPLKTRAGWLLIYHGVATHFAAANIYQAGVALLDLVDPRRLIARGRENILEPRERCELTGQVPNVVFPTGLIAEDIDADGCAKDSSVLKLYYGAADTCVCLATTTVAELLAELG